MGPNELQKKLSISLFVFTRFVTVARWWRVMLCPIFFVPVPDDDHVRAFKWENQGSRLKPWGSRAPTLMIPGRPFHIIVLVAII